MGRLSTHVLDTVHGQPAANVVIDLHVLEAGGAWRLIKTTRTNTDGRTDTPLLNGLESKAGTYMLSFHVGEYFARFGSTGTSPPFLDVVPVRFTIADTDGHYHVPLLASPWSYTTYRGS